MRVKKICICILGFFLWFSTMNINAKEDSTKILGRSMTLSKNIVLNYFVQGSDSTSYLEYRVGDQKEKVYFQKDKIEFPCVISIKNVLEPITIRIVNKNGEVECEDVYSVSAYLDSLEKDSRINKIVDILLEYGKLASSTISLHDIELRLEKTPIFVYKSKTISNIEDMDEVYTIGNYSYSLSSFLKEAKHTSLEKAMRAYYDLFTPSIHRIVAYGDSRIQNGKGTTSVDSYLAKLLNKESVNYGFAGQASGEIAFSMGVNEVFVSFNNNTISKGLNKISTLQSSVGYFMQLSDNYLNGCPCTISGIEGYLYQYKNQAYFVANSSKEKVEDLESVIPMNNTNNKHDFFILWTGKNDFDLYKNENFETNLVDTISSMVSYFESVSNHYVILGETTSYKDEYKKGGSARRVMDSYNQALEEKYGNHFIDIQKELCERGLELANIKPTKEDEQALKAGLLPPSLMSDSVHQNPKCREVIAQIIFEHMKKQGWIV